MLQLLALLTLLLAATATGLTTGFTAWRTGQLLEDRAEPHDPGTAVDVAGDRGSDAYRPDPPGGYVGALPVEQPAPRATAPRATAPRHGGGKSESASRDRSSREETPRRRSSARGDRARRER